MGVRNPGSSLFIDMSWSSCSMLLVPDFVEIMLKIYAKLFYLSS